MNAVTGYLSGTGTKQETTVEENTQQEKKEQGEKQADYDFTLQDQYGEEHTLSEYKGKVVFLNFWATWCSYHVRQKCRIFRNYTKNMERMEKKQR